MIMAGAHPLVLRTLKAGSSPCRKGGVTSILMLPVRTLQPYAGKIIVFDDLAEYCTALAREFR